MTADPTPTRLVLIRHAEPQAHVDSVVAGPRGDTGLSPIGRKQAEALRARLARTGELAPVDLVVSSTLPRAIETGDAVAEALGVDDVARDPLFVEFDPGEADGLTWEEFEQLYPVPPSGWDPFLNRAPGAESWAEFQLRAQRRLHQLTTEHRGRTTVVVCHGGIIVASMYSFFGLGFGGGNVWLEPAFTSLTEWVLRPDDIVSRRPHRWVLVRYNDFAHLAEAAAS